MSSPVNKSTTKNNNKQRILTKRFFIINFVTGFIYYPLFLIPTFTFYLSENHTLANLWFVGSIIPGPAILGYYACYIIFRKKNLDFISSLSATFIAILGSMTLVNLVFVPSIIWQYLNGDLAMLSEVLGQIILGNIGIGVITCGLFLIYYIGFIVDEIKEQVTDVKEDEVSSPSISSSLSYYSCGSKLEENSQFCV